MESPRKSDSSEDSSPLSRDDQLPEDPPVQPARPDPPVHPSRPPRPSSRAHPCGYDCEFVERPPTQVQCECPVCLQVLRDPQQVTCCGNSFCKVCTDRVVKDSTPCPTCNAVAFSIFPNKGLRRTLGGFRVYCSNKDEGCEWVGELGDLERHLNSKPSIERQLDGCPFEEVACIYCTCLFQRLYIHEHQFDTCPKRQFQCEHCGEIDSYENITDIHSQKCPNFPIACRQHCGENVQRQEMDNHVSRDCPLTKVDCAYQVFGCEVRPARKDIPTHITESVADHTAMLAKSMRKIKDSARQQSNQLQDNVTELLDTVSKQKTSINRLQNKLMAMKRQHFQHMFLGLAVVLAIAAIGIGVVSHRGDVKLAVQFNNTFLLHTVLENKTHDLITQTTCKLEELGGVKNDLSAKIEDIQEFAKRNMNSLTGKLEVVQDSFASLEVQLQTEIDRKMTDFKTANAPWFSPPFYTHTHGYKMCIRVDANGNGNGKGTHVSVFLFLMRGMFDDDLKWPFQDDVTIELVNQLNPTSNLVREIRFSRTSDPEIVSKVTSRDRAASGFGWYKFIAHSELDYNTDEQTQYLKHDSLIFRISKVKNDLSAKFENIQEFTMNSLKGKLEDIQKNSKRNMNSWEGKWQDSFASLEVQLQTEIDSKMTDFKKNKTANAPWYSPPFYTHTHGYKMCIRVHANGYGKGAGTHVSVFLFLMPGMFDNDLKWPFQGSVTIELINRLNPISNLVEEIHFSLTSDPEIVDKVTSRDRAAVGFGYHKFIAHSELGYNADEQTLYLKHDSLIFRISKVTNVK